MAIRKKTLLLAGVAIAVLYLWSKSGDCGCGGSQT